MKKRKLNSKNPKYQKEDESTIKVHNEFVKEVKGVKIYKTYFE
jgi:hypothetical protein